MFHYSLNHKDLKKKNPPSRKDKRENLVGRLNPGYQPIRHPLRELPEPH